MANARPPEKSAVPQLIEGASFADLNLAPEDWFILSRVDGKSTVNDLILVSPVNQEETLKSLLRLAQAGLIALPEPKAAEQERSKRKAPLEAPPWWKGAISDHAFEADPKCTLEPELQSLIDLYYSHIKSLDFYTFLGVEKQARAGAIKRAYFKLSKSFHPDRYFRKELGSLRGKIEGTFKHLNEIHRVLGNPKKRREYDALLERDGSAAPERQSSPSHHEGKGHQSRPPIAMKRPKSTRTRPRPLSELLGEAKAAERSQRYAEAIELYSAALEQRRSPELMNRIAECLIRQRKDLDVAAQWARQSIQLERNNARYWVALAYIQELQQSFVEAEASYQQALHLDPSHQGAQARLAALRQR